MGGMVCDVIDIISNDSCNELNAAYAADGYARTKNGIACLVTTFGVGELSAINGIAGAYSERVGVVHIVGTPSTLDQKNGALLHHTLGNGDFSVFAKMSEPVVRTSANLTDPVTAPAEIDRVLRTCYLEAHPVYIGIPTDMAYAEIDDKALSTNLDLDNPPNEEEIESHLIKEITKLVEDAEKPVILVDACAIRHRVLSELGEFIDKTKFPVFCTPMGKGAIDETRPTFGGVYIGSVTAPGIKEVVEASDLVISIGGLKSDFNTGSFSYHIPKSSTIEFHSDHTCIKYAVFPGVGMKALFPKVTAALNVKEIEQVSAPKFENVVPDEHKEKTIITHDYFWPTVGNDLLRKDDVVVTETGTSNFGILDTKFPPGVTAVSQVLWGSIGWSVGALLGAAEAAAELNKRVILFVGDGSLQLTVQEISTMIRSGLKPIIFVLNNDGYTIERLIHDGPYNDINTSWDYQHLLQFFGAKEQASYRVTTQDEVNALFANEEFNDAKVIQLVEVVMEKWDAPRALKVQAKLTAENNERKK